MTVGPIGSTAYRTPLVLAASATALSAVIGLLAAVALLLVTVLLVGSGVVAALLART